MGDVLVVWVGAQRSLTSAPTVSSLSHTGVTAWNKLINEADGTGLEGAEIWWGVVTATGSATLTVNLNVTPTVAEAAVLQFNSSVAGTWTADTATNVATGKATSGNYPSITPIASGELALCAGRTELGSGVWGGATTGYVYATYGSPNVRLQAVYSLSCASPSTPAWTQSTSEQSAFCQGALYVPTPPTPHPVHISPVAALRASNF
ncbi:MAG: hypothetical protein KGI71_05625 [Patescibacteria group bacterium]|nr:hypothetical protein [Patescibacteria group bacterium]